MDTVVYKIKFDLCFHGAYRLILNRCLLLLFQDTKNGNDPILVKNTQCEGYSMNLQHFTGLVDSQMAGI